MLLLADLAIGLIVIAVAFVIFKTALSILKDENSKKK